MPEGGEDAADRQVGGCSSMVERQPSKLDTWVRFPSPAPAFFAGPEGRIETEDELKCERGAFWPHQAGKREYGEG